jgi:hypothetical protein
VGYTNQKCLNKGESDVETEQGQNADKELRKNKTRKNVSKSSPGHNEKALTPLPFRREAKAMAESTLARLERPGGDSSRRTKRVRTRMG